MGSTTNRNIKEGIILHLHGLLQDVVYWVDYDTETVVEGTLAELGEECCRPERVPSPLGIDSRYHLDRESGTKVMRWEANGKEVVAFEFDTREDALAKLEDIWKSEIFGCETGSTPHWHREDAQAELEDWLREKRGD